MAEEMKLKRCPFCGSNAYPAVFVLQKLMGIFSNESVRLQKLHDMLEEVK